MLGICTRPRPIKAWEACTLALDPSRRQSINVARTTVTIAKVDMKYRGIPSCQDRACPGKNHLSAQCTVGTGILPHSLVPGAAPAGPMRINLESTTHAGNGEHKPMQQKEAKYYCILHLGSTDAVQDCRSAVPRRLTGQSVHLPTSELGSGSSMIDQSCFANMRTCFFDVLSSAWLREGKGAGSQG
jgi:hypothetical protein